MDALETDDSISDTIDFSFLLELEGIEDLLEPIRPDCCHPNSSQDGQNPGYPLVDLGIINTADFLADIGKENMTEINNSCSMSTMNTSPVQEMSTECNKRKHSDEWFLDELALNEPSSKRSVLEYIELNTAQPRIIKKRVRNVEPSMRINFLKVLTSKKVRATWNQICRDMFMNGTEVCCSKNCWVKWKLIDGNKMSANWN